MKIDKKHVKVASYADLESASSSLVISLVMKASDVFRQVSMRLSNSFHYCWNNTFRQHRRSQGFPSQWALNEAQDRYAKAGNLF